jgi:glycerol-3-phosphate acyltransferase PlsY
MNVQDYFTFGLIAYLLGSIPTAVWIGKAYYGMDVREHGSKNAGATNTFRVLGKKPGVIVLLIDILKGALASSLPYFALSAMITLPDSGPNAEQLIRIGNVQIVASILAVVGHVFPIFAGFRGGKGVATSLGVIVGLQPIAALICLAVFLCVFIASKYVSLGAMVAAVIFPIVVHFVLKNESLWMTLFSLLLSVLVIFAHRKNIGRLWRGEENRMNLFKR